MNRLTHTHRRWEAHFEPDDVTSHYHSNALYKVSYSMYERCSDIDVLNAQFTPSSPCPAIFCFDHALFCIDHVFFILILIVPSHQPLCVRVHDFEHILTTTFLSLPVRVSMPPPWLWPWPWVCWCSTIHMLSEREKERVSGWVREWVRESERVGGWVSECIITRLL